jgi:hypothetical protein
LLALEAHPVKFARCDENVRIVFSRELGYSREWISDAAWAVV